MPPLSAIVLVGGFGTRLRPVTYHVPKQLIPMAGQCALYHVFDILPKNVDRIGLACGYKSEVIERYLREHPYPLPVSVVREATPLGTGGGMKNAENLATDPFILLNGDVVSGVDISTMIKWLNEKGGVGVMSLFHVDDTTPYGVADLGPDYRIRRFVEKPDPASAPSHWINAGASVWRREIMEAVPAGKAVSFEREILPGLLEQGVFGLPFDSWWEDAGTLPRVLNAQRILFTHPERRRTPWNTPEGNFVMPPVAVGAGVTIEAKRVGPYVTLGNGVSAEEGVVIEDAVIMDGAKIGRGAHVKHSIIGPGYYVAAGARVENACLALTPSETPEKT